MPRLLYRYMLSELLRVFALTTLVLVTIIAFGATIKPLTSDNLLTAADTVKYLLLAMVPMLQFALPFAAGFASTMVLHRMTADNEILAAAVSGISYRRLLLPLAWLGILLSLVLVLLTQWAIPRFWTLMEQTIAADVTKLFQASIQRGVPFQAGSVQIYADDMRVVANPRDTEATTRLILFRVAAAEVDDAGRVDTDVTAQQAVVDIYRKDGQTYIMLAMHETAHFDGTTGQLAYLPQMEPARPIVVPGVLRDELRAMTRSQLLRLRANPDQYRPIRESREQLAEMLLSRRIWRELNDHLRAHGSLEIAQTGEGRRRYVVRAAGIRDGRFIPGEAGAVQVTQFDGRNALRRMAAAEVRLNQVGSRALGQATFELELLNVEVTDLLSPETVNRRERLADRNLMPAGIELPDTTEQSSATLLVAVAAMDSPPAPIRQVASELERRHDALQNEIRARLLMRYAQSATGFLLLLLGASLAMLLRGALPLAIYVCAFLPSILDLILISGGDKMMRDGDLYSGFFVMWSGNFALLGFLVFVYLRLMRN